MTFNLNIPSALVEAMVHSLVRIADALDRAVPPILLPGDTKPPPPEEALAVRTDASLAQVEEEQDRREEYGLGPDDLTPGEEVGGDRPAMHRLSPEEEITAERLDNAALRLDPPWNRQDGVKTTEAE